MNTQITEYGIQSNNSLIIRNITMVDGLIQLAHDMHFDRIEHGDELNDYRRMTKEEECLKIIAVIPKVIPEHYRDYAVRAILQYIGE